jgi:GAF domain-containing protein
VIAIHADYPKRCSGRTRAPPSAADRDDRGGQLDARSGEVLALVARKVADVLARTRASSTSTTSAARARAARHARDEGRGDDEASAHAPGEGITAPPRGARPDHAPGAGASRCRASSSSRTCRRTSTSRSRVPIVARERLAGALNVRTIAPRSSRRRDRARVAIAAQVAQTIEHAQLYAQAQRRVASSRRWPRSRGRLGVALPRGVARGDREDDDGGGRRDRRGARARGRQHRVARRARGQARRALPLRWKRRQIGELVCDRDTPFTATSARCSPRSRTTRRSRSSTGAR